MESPATEEEFTPLSLEPLRAKAVPVSSPIGQALPVSRGKLLLKGLRKTVSFINGEPLLPLILTMVLFAGMMAVSFGQMAVGIAQVQAAKHAEEEATDWDQFDPDSQRAKLQSQLVRDTLIFEGLDTFLVFLGLLIIARPPKGGPQGTWPFAWVLGLPALALVLGLNIGFTHALRILLGVETDPEEELVSLGWKQGILAILLVCAQPAIIEELFFRHLLYGHLRPHIGVHGAVAVSSVVFGMAHLGNPIGWPILMIAGAMLGYARAYSGGLILPIILHFLHNFFVLLLNYLLYNQ